MNRHQRINIETVIMLLVVAGIALILLGSGIDWQTVDTETILMDLGFLR